MPIVVSRRCVYGIVCCCLLLAMADNTQARLYRWENDQGQIIYSDQIPPEDAKHKKEALNKKGRVTEVIEGAKSKEQWELEARLDALRREQEKIIAKQKADDKVLISTFRSLDDMRRMLEGKLSSIEIQKRFAESNLQRLELQLKNQQKSAAKYEREGRVVPKPVLKEIADTERQILQARIEVERHEQKQAQVKKAFEADMARYAYLTQSKEAAEQVSNTTAELKAEDELGLFSCENTEQCDKGWQLARTFVQKFSSTSIDVDNDKLIMGGDPADDRDLSLSVSKMMRTGYKTQIFLDIRCRKSSYGKELCAGSAVSDIRRAFRPFIESGLTAQQ
ncbi:MAG: DUF4124 domain-containing protein [Gammaproteobacteria bacterium]